MRAELKLRTASPADLDDINAVIQRAVMTWNLPERVKRLAMPTYIYGEHDLPIWACSSPRTAAAS